MKVGIIIGDIAIGVDIVKLEMYCESNFLANETMSGHFSRKAANSNSNPLSQIMR